MFQMNIKKNLRYCNSILMTFMYCHKYGSHVIIMLSLTVKQYSSPKLEYIVQVFPIFIIRIVLLLI